MAVTITCPTPAPDESYERYAIRAHRYLASRVTDPEDRNLLIEEIWRESRGPTAAEKMAADKLGDDFVRKANVCYFTEHETVDGKGQPRKYDLRKLVKILRNANHRIADVAAFPAISDGHTPAPGSGQPQPDVLGYVGNYRLGMLGREDPKWAIFADEYHSKAHADRLATRPRRSVELWTFKDSGKSHFDPVAALGAEAPRLPLPVAFQMTNEGEAEVEKYTVAAPAAPATGAFPGGGNTHVKTFKKEPVKMALSDQDLAQVIGALTETPQWKFLTQTMQAEQADDVAAAQGDLELNAADEELPPVDEDEDVDIDVDVDLEPEGEGAEPEAEATPEEMPPEVEDEDTADLADLLAEPDEEEQFAMSANQDKDLAEKYSALQASHVRLIRSHGQMRKQVAKMAKERHDAHRKATLMELNQKYPGVIELDDEFQTCLYSAGSQMDAEAFKSHCATIEKYAARVAPIAPMVPGGVVTQDADSEKYEAALTDAAVQICTAAADAGKPITFDEGLAQARKQSPQS